MITEIKIMISYQHSILKKLIDKGVNVSTSTIKRALKMRKNAYKNLILLQWS